jgi:hypothetical protein
MAKDPAAPGDRIQRERLRRMAPGERIHAAMTLFWFARRLKESSVRASDPTLSDAEVRTRVNAAFLYARDE